ncbi:MAG: glycosyltransferase [Proteobacteria bacterium]|nr:glycosyltransferase [Pseudomonadota bacterium]
MIVPCYRCGDTIRRAVGSVAYQSLRPEEVILVEDYSQDETLAVLRDLAKQYEPEWIRVVALLANGGPGTARNVGWERASRPYIAFLDADDAWHPDKIKIQYGWMVEHPNAVLSGHKCVELNPGDTPPELDQHWKIRTVGKIPFLLSNQFSTRSVMLKRHLPYRFRPGKRHVEDYLLWLQIFLDGGQVAYFDLPLAYYFKPLYGSSGLSRDLWKMEQGELDTYWQLYSEGRIGGILAFLLSFYSMLKYIRRAAVTKITQWFGSVH